MKELLKGFEQLFDMEDKQERGRRFETLLVKLFHRSGFDASSNPGAARPRQTDLWARYAENDFLVEAKWQSAHIDVEVVAGMHDRLSRAPQNMIGLIFSMSPFTKSAIQDVEVRRAREVLLFSPFEVNALFSGRFDLADLIAKKRESLRRDGKVAFSVEDNRWLEEIGDLPSAHEFIEMNGQRVAVTSSVSRTGVLFARGLPDVSWNRIGGPGVDIHLRPDINNLSELRNFLAWLYHKFDLSGVGAFAITQLDASWHGVGARELLRELERRDARYKEIGLQRIHHSEDFGYFDKVGGGFLTLYARNQVADESLIFSADLFLRLPGIPVDLRPFVDLCRKLREQDAFFSQSAHGEAYMVRLDAPLPLEVLGRVIRHQDEAEPLVAGIVAKNPLFQKPEIARKLTEDYSPMHLLSEEEILICSLSDWHGVGDKTDGYFMHTIEASWTGSDFRAVNPVCTWKEIVERGPRSDTDERASRRKQRVLDHQMRREREANLRKISDPEK